MSARYIITDDQRFFDVRAVSGGPVVATLTRPLVIDYKGNWELHDTTGKLIGAWPYRPLRFQVTAALELRGLMG